MIQEFSIQNFLSFKDKQTISFLATSDKTLSKELIVEPKDGIRLLKMLLIYGANASGKSNLLQAIQALWFMLFSPTYKEHEKVKIYEPFELQKELPTKYNIVFWANGRKFEYHLENNESSILYERLDYTTDKEVLSLLYEREKNGTIKFGSTLDIKARQRNELNKETLGNHTVLSTLNKKNIDVPLVMRELYEWIKNNVHELDIYNKADEIAEQANRNPTMKNLILELLNKADFDIVDFQLIDTEIPKDIQNEILNNKFLSEQEKNIYLRPRKQLLFTHKVMNNEFRINFGSESKGTKTYFRLARILYDLKSCGCIIMDDELDDSLHYDLLIHYLKTYLESESQSQLIFTTHNQLLLDEDWMIRRDMIWFTDKDKETASTALSRASDMGIHKNLSLMNAYRIGKLGAKPTLGSTILNSNTK